jgi:hypothetical protein
MFSSLRGVQQYSRREKKKKQTQHAAKTMKTYRTNGENGFVANAAAMAKYGCALVARFISAALLAGVAWPSSTLKSMAIRRETEAKHGVIV